MLKHRKQPARHSLDKEDDGDFIPPTSLGMAVPDGPAEAPLPTEQRCATQAVDPPLPKTCRTASTHLAEMLGTAAELVAKLDGGEPSSEKPRGVDIVSATVQAHDSPAAPPEHAASILVVTRGGEAAIFPHSPAVPRDVPALHRRLPFVREFTAAGGDCEVFKPCFSTSCTLVGRMEEEALKALPTSLNNNALAAFYVIPPAQRSMLQQAFKDMAAVHDPPSSVHNRFAEHQRGETEMPLAFRSALLSLPQAAFPKMEPAGIDSLVLERLLGLAKELNVTLPASEEDDPSSLVIARCIQTHLGLKRHKGLVTCAAPASGREELEEDEPAPLCAAVDGGAGRRCDMASGGGCGCPRGAFPYPGSSRAVCYNCGLPEHVASGTRDARGLMKMGRRMRFASRIGTCPGLRGSGVVTLPTLPAAALPEGSLREGRPSPVRPPSTPPPLMA
ncbi:unnamed protein product [Lampetra planeri]